jgi:hypothetical protein
MKYYFEAILEIMKVTLATIFPPWLIIAIILLLPFSFAVYNSIKKTVAKHEFYECVSLRVETDNYPNVEQVIKVRENIKRECKYAWDTKDVKKNLTSSYKLWQLWQCAVNLAEEEELKVRNSMLPNE